MSFNKAIPIVTIPKKILRHSIPRRTRICNTPEVAMTALRAFTIFLLQSKYKRKLFIHDRYSPSMGNVPDIPGKVMPICTRHASTS
jgi:hypothetical protein